jgi:hypothetical protein
MADKPDEPGPGSLSLEQIEHVAWGDPPTGATRLVRTAHALRRKPVATLTPEELRLLISQQIGVGVLLPFALAVLAEDPLAEGDFYPGDLLVAAMRQPPEYWAIRPGQTAALRSIAASARDTGVGIQADVNRFLSMTEQYA